MDKTEMMENNLGILHKYYNRYSYWSDEYEDIRQECALAYCKAILKYDETRGYTLSTYVWNTIDNHLKQLNYLRNMQKRTLPEGATYFSLNQKRKTVNDKEVLTYAETVGYIDDEYDEIDTWCALEAAKGRMTKKVCEAVDLKLAGNTNEKIGRMLGQSTSAVTEKLRRSRPIIMKELQENM